MATYERAGEVKKMGIGGMAVRLAAAGIATWAAVAGGNYAMDKIKGEDAVIEQGYVNPKSLSIQGKKNANGNVESYLQYKNGGEAVSLPCMKGPTGPLCGTVDYWWTSIGAPQREDLTVSEWPLISNDSKHGIMSSELQKVLDTFYGTQKQVQQQQPASQYTNAKK